MSVSTSAPSRLSQMPTVVRALLAVVVSVVVSSVICLVVAAVAHAAGASQDFRALMPPTFIALIVFGCVIGTIGWLIVRSAARRPRALLRVLVPLVLVVSLVPDILVGASAGMPGVSWVGVIGLMVMHVVVAAVLVTTLSAFLPAPEVSARSARSARSY